MGILDFMWQRPTELSPQTTTMLGALAKFGAAIAPQNPTAQALGTLGYDTAQSQLARVNANKQIGAQNTQLADDRKQFADYMEILKQVAGRFGTQNAAVSPGAAGATPTGQASATAQLPPVGTGFTPQLLNGANVAMGGTPAPVQAATTQPYSPADLARDYLAKSMQNFSAGMGNAPAIPLIEGAPDPAITNSLLNNAMAIGQARSSSDYRRAQLLHGALDMAAGMEEAQLRRQTAKEAAQARIDAAREKREAPHIIKGEGIGIIKYDPVTDTVKQLMPGMPSYQKVDLEGGNIGLLDKRTGKIIDTGKKGKVAKGEDAELKTLKEQESVLDKQLRSFNKKLADPLLPDSERSAILNDPDYVRLKTKQDQVLTRRAEKAGLGGKGAADPRKLQLMNEARTRYPNKSEKELEAEVDRFLRGLKK